MLTKEFQFKQFLKTNCFNIHVGLKCKEKHASRYFRDEYKKVNRLSDLFKKLSHKKESVKINVRIVYGRHKRISDNEQETKNGAIQIELSPPPVSKNGTADSRK